MVTDLRPNLSRDRRRLKYVCNACGEEKGASAFSREDTNTCRACRDAAQAVLDRALSIDPAVTAELARRELARRSYEQFVRYLKPHLKLGWVHVDLAYRLQRFMEAVRAGAGPRLLIRMPPRHGKSEFCTRDFPPFVLGQEPDWEVIQTSYNLGLAEEFSREARALVRMGEYRVLFPGTELDPEYQNIEAWRLKERRGGYVAAGIGGGIIGKGAHVFVIDDPIKNVEEAESQLVRDNQWRWYTSVAMSRLAPGGGMLVVMTSWHEDDLSCRLMDLEEEGFELVIYAAIAEADEWKPLAGNEHLEPYALERDDTHPEGPRILMRRAGEALHPERYSAEELNRRKRVLTDREWSALYQGAPVPEGGTIFKPEHFWVRERPNTAFYEPVLLQAWDFAITTNESSNWNVGVCGLLLPEDLLLVVGIERFRSQDTVNIATALWEFVELHRHWAKSLQLGVEDGQIWKGVKSTFDREAKTHRPVVVKELVPLTDKVLRARPLQARAQRRRLAFLDGVPYYDVVKRELLRFPGGKFDDCVDALAWLARLSLEVEPPRPRQKRVRIAERPWRERLASQIAAQTRKTRSHMSS